jgi:hypothetical protein
MELAILIAALAGVGDFVRRCRNGEGDPRRSIWYIAGEACFTGIISGLIGLALQHPSDLHLPRVDWWNPFAGSRTAAVVIGRAVQVRPATCTAPRYPDEVTCELALEPLSGRGNVTVEVACHDIHIWDDRGGEYFAAQVVLGSDISQRCGTVGATLIEGLSTRLEFTFLGLTAEAARLPRVVLPIRYADGRTEQLTISFAEIL